MIDERLLWKGSHGFPLLVVYPGGTGTHRPLMRGFDAIAAHFWMRGFSVYVGEVAGQDGHLGEFLLQRALDESRRTVGCLVTSLYPTSVCLFGSCSGGTIATWLASESSRVRSLILYETLPEYSAESARRFGERAVAAGVTLSPTYLNESIHTVDVAPRVTCPVLLLSGDKSVPPVVTAGHMQRLAAGFSSAGELEVATIEGADHNVTRGSELEPLGNLLRLAQTFIDKYLLHLPNREACDR